MRINHLYEAAAGTFVGVRLTTTSNARLCGWMDQNLIKNPQPADKLHTTLVLSKTEKFNHQPMAYIPPVPVLPETYAIELFGPEQNILVLTFVSPFLEKRHLQLRKKYGLSWDFPTYSPHITLTHEVQEINTDLVPPDFELEFGREYVEEFNPDAID